jgi:hypothetical protein
LLERRARDRRRQQQIVLLSSTLSMRRSNVA